MDNYRYPYPGDGHSRLSETLFVEPGDESDGQSGISAYSVSAYRVLYILLVLVQQRSLSLDALNAFLVQNPLIEKAYNGETITKYVNTLRSVGCDIPRAKNRYNYHYQLLKGPVPASFDLNELLAAHQLLKIMASQPDESLHVRYSRLLQEVAWALGSESHASQLFDPSVMVVESSQASIQESRQRLTHYRKLCQQGHVLEVTYGVRFGPSAAASADSVVQVTLEPFRVVQQGNNFYLMGVDCKALREVKLNLACILDYRVLPQRVKNRPRAVQVMFRIMGRLAKTYRLYPGEIVTERIVSEEGPSRKGKGDSSELETIVAITVKNRTDDVEGLLSRLLRYGECCEVMAPAYVRQEMAERVHQMWRVFEAETLLTVPSERLLDPCQRSAPSPELG